MFSQHDRHFETVASSAKVHCAALSPDNKIGENYPPP
jgi:hypothetical protein